MHPIGGWHISATCAGGASAGPRSVLAPETRFMLDVIAAGFGAIPPAVPDGLDWEVFAATVREHRVAPHMTAALALDLPAPVHQRVQRRRRRATHAALALGAELLRVTRAFDHAGIAYLALKGPAFAALLQTEPFQREARDIDLLVRPAQMEAALAVLDGLGYGGDDGVSHHHNAIELRRPDFPFPIELHTRLGDCEQMLPLAALRPFETAVTVQLSSAHVPTMAPEPAMVFAAYHGSKHRWQRLFWLVDMAVGMTGGRVDWGQTMDLAHRVGCQRHLALGLVLAHDLLGVAIPAAAGLTPTAQASARRAAAALSPILSRPFVATQEEAWDRMGRLRFLRWDVGLYSRLRAKLAALWLYAQPTEADRQLIALPSWLSYTYYGVRIVRIASSKRVAATRHRPT